MRLAGTHVLLTGATGALGAPLAEQLAARGAHVCLVARGAEALQDLADRVGGHPVPADLTAPAAPAAVLAAATARFGPVEILVHNAGVEVLDELAEADPGEVARAVSLNLTAPLVLTRLALPSMLRRGRGHVVAVSSLAGVATFPGLSVYGATKAGLTHGMAGLRGELRGTEIGTTTVEIGPVDSPMMERISRHPPTAQAFRRALRLRALRTLSSDAVALAVVDAVEQDRVAVRLPRRASPLAAIAATPRAVVRTVLTGIPTATSAGAATAAGAARPERFSVDRR